MKTKTFSKNLITLLIMVAVMLSAGVIMLAIQNTQSNQTTQVFADEIDWTWEDGTVADEVTWKIIEINSVNTLLIKKYSGDGEISNYPIYTSGPWGTSGYTSVVIADDVTKIGNSAFDGCANIESVTIGISVHTIVGGAFRGCTSLESITIPDSVETIGSQTFNACTNLTSVTIGSSVTSIADYTFLACTNVVVTFLSTTPPTQSYSFKHQFSGQVFVSKIIVPYSADHSVLNAYKTAWSYVETYIEEAPEPTAETGVFVDIVLPTVFVALVGTLACMYVLQGRKQKTLIAR